MSRLIVVGIIVAIMMACSKKEEAIPRKVICKDGILIDAGIIGGQAVKNSDSIEKELAAGTLFIYAKADSKDAETGATEYNLCTASLIDDNIALTAAHCVSEENIKDSSSLNVAFSLDPVCQAQESSPESTLRKATAIIRHQNFNLDSKNFSQNDLALVRFEGKAPAGKTPMKLLFNEVELNSLSEIIVTGYGKTTDYNQFDASGAILRYANITPLIVSKASDKITTTNKKAILYFDQSHGEGACAGDSGGPTILKKQDNLYVIGVNSAVDSMDSEDLKTQSEVTCKQGLRSTSVVAQKDWILDNYKRLLNSNSRGVLSR